MNIEILHAKTCDSRKLSSPSAAVKRIADSANELRGIVWVDYGTDFAFRERINASISIPANNGQTGRRGFKKRDAKSLAGTGHDKNVSETKVVRKLAVRDVPSKLDCMRDARGLSKSLEALPVITIPDDEI